MGRIVKVFPARAGMSRPETTTKTRLIGVPRASGDEPSSAVEIPAAKWCSPRERG